MHLKWEPTLQPRNIKATHISYVQNHFQGDTGGFQEKEVMRNFPQATEMQPDMSIYKITRLLSPERAQSEVSIFLR